MTNKIHVINVDFDLNVAFTEEGHILQVESYVDEYDTPCLPEEASAVYLIVGKTRFERFDILGEEDDFDSSY